MKKAIVGTAVKFTFDGLEPLVFESTKAATETRDYAEMHGWMSRLGDMAAIPKAQKDGSVITVTEAMRRDAILEGITHYESGTEDWAMKASVRAAPQNPAVLKLATALNITYEEAMAKLAEMALAEMGE